MRSNQDSFTTRARRAQLVDAAIEVIAELGYPQASVAKIAQRVGIAKSVALYHFATKDDIVAGVTTKVMTDAMTVMVPAIAAERTAIGRLTAYIRSNVEFVRGNRTAAIAMREIDTGYRSADGKRFDEYLAEQVAVSPPPPEFGGQAKLGDDFHALDPAHVLADGVAAGELRADLDPRLTADLVRGALDAAVAKFARDPDYDITALGEQLITTALNGIRQ